MADEDAREAYLDIATTPFSAGSPGAYAVRLVLITALVFTVVMAAIPTEPKFLIGFDDKAQHIAAFATLAALATLAYPKASLDRIGERLSFLGALIEVVQAMPQVHRDCDIYDWLADTIAVVVVLGVVAIVRYSRRRRSL